tara:strand:+ start:669 stop:923 length:255 start_codon:yes stop_codon:yes gene_type:complete
MAEQQQQQMNMNVDVKNTTIIETPDGGVVFQQGVLLRKVSKFVVGADEDALMPIPVFYDPTTGKILESTVPAEIREEYKDYTIS